MRAYPTLLEQATKPGMPDQRYVFRLYICGTSPHSYWAIKNVESILQEKLVAAYTLKIIDVLENPEPSEEDKIVATPTLIKVMPPPKYRFIGDLSNLESAAQQLEFLKYLREP